MDNMEFEFRGRLWGLAVLLAILAVASAVSGVAALQIDSGGGSFAFEHVTVIDGTGAGAKLNQTVFVSRERIIAVGPSGKVQVPSTARAIDATGQFLIPGLWDVHVHTRYEGIDHLPLLVANGITSARDMGAPWQHLIEINRWREQITKGQRVGPRMLTSGPLLDGPGSRWSHAAVVSSQEEARLTVGRLKREGADFAKVYELLSRESFFAVAEQAKLQGLPFVGHVPWTISASEASDAGQRSIEHLGAILLGASAREEEFIGRPQGQRPTARLLIDSFRASKLAAISDRMRRNQTRVVPTLSLTWTGLGAARKDPVVVKAERLRYVPAGYRSEWERAPAAEVESQQVLLDKLLDLVRELHVQGVQLLAGTDVVKPFFVPGASLHDELSLLVKAGLSEMEALETATRKPARFFNLTDQGTIEPGMRADLVLLDANPLQNIDNTRKIRTVVTAGRLFERKALDAMLADIEKAASQWTGTPTGR
jgi:Amidohydrolase family